MVTDTDAAKRVLRGLLRAARPGGDTSRLVSRLLDLAVPPGTLLGGFWPLPGEPDLVPAWSGWAARGHPVALPETTAPGLALRFRLWDPARPLLPGRFGTSHPDGAVCDPALLFVPLLAWDRTMLRLGYGGGYYDRTLAARPTAAALGVGFAAQEVASLPAGPYDVRLDGMVTEAGLSLAEGRGLADLVSGRHRRTQRT